MSNEMPEDLPYRDLLEAAPDAIVTVGERGTIQFANRQTERIFGYAARELIGQPIEILVPEKFRSTHIGHTRGFLSSPKPRPMGSGLDLFGRRKDGTDFPVEISLSPHNTESQGLLVSAAIRDITDRKQMEAATKLATERLKNAIDSVLDPFSIFDADGRLVMCNSAYRVMFGSVTGSLIGRPYDEMIRESITLGIFALGQESPDAFRERIVGYRRHPSGTIDLRTTAGSYARIKDRRTPDGGTVSVIWDLTEDVLREAELERMHALAEAASAAKSDFLSSMSHELRTPLNAVLGFAQLMMRDKKTPLTDRQRERIAQILKGGEHLLNLINDVLDLSRIESGHVTISTEPVSVLEVLEEVKSTLNPMAERAGIRVVIEPLRGDLPTITADRTRFAQILMNYGSNAIKYNVPNGVAEFQVSYPADGRVRITVSDTGMGIPDDKHGKIFLPFQRAGQEMGAIEGTGIGLSITKRLAELMGGSVGFESTPGNGSKFWVDMPLHASAVQSVRGALASAANSTLADGEEHHLVLYVEDNPANISFVRSLLEDFDTIHLVTAPTAEIGIEIARTRRPRLILMDINLPGMSGLDALQILRMWPETKEIPIVALTAAASDRDRKRGEEAGFFRYLTKPVKVEELTSAIEALLRRRT